MIYRYFSGFTNDIGSGKELALYYIRENGTIIKDTPAETVVLSPSLYWYAHADLPARSVAKAKKLADSVLASRPSSYTSIHVEKRGNGFDCYAFDENRVESLIPDSVAKTAPRYFLQQFSDQMPLRIDDTLIADTINGICIEIHEESRSIPSLDSIDIKSLAKPFNKSTSKSVSSWMAALFVVLLLTAAGTDLALRYQTLNALKQKSAANDSRKTMYEIKALSKKYRKIDSEQKRLRSAIKKALDSHMKLLECDAKKGCSFE